MKHTTRPSRQVAIANAAVREMARVQIKIGEKVWNEDVALSKSAELDEVY